MPSMKTVHAACATLRVHPRLQRLILKLHCERSLLSKAADFVEEAAGSAVSDRPRKTAVAFSSAPQAAGKSKLFLF